MKKKIIITGGGGLLANELVKTNPNYELFPFSRKEMDTTIFRKAFWPINNINPNIIIHCGAMTNPMINHVKEPNLSICKNIIGTANIALICYYLKIKLVYISTDYIYPGESNISKYFKDNITCLSETKTYNSNGIHSETDPVYPVNNYAWSKLGGECSVRLIPDSLILRCSFTNKPFKHNNAFIDSYKSFLYIDEIAPIIWKLIKKSAIGIYNVGGKRQSIYDFAKTSNKKVKKISRTEIKDQYIPHDTSLDLTKLKELLLND